MLRISKSPIKTTMQFTSCLLGPLHKEKENRTESHCWGEWGEMGRNGNLCVTLIGRENGVASDEHRMGAPQNKQNIPKLSYHPTNLHPTTFKRAKLQISARYLLLCSRQHHLQCPSRRSGWRKENSQSRQGNLVTFCNVDVSRDYMIFIVSRS